MTRVNLVVAAAAVVLACSSPANAATVKIDPSDPINGITWSVTPSNFTHSAYYNANPTPQSPAAIDTLLSRWFGLNLTLVANADSCDVNGLTCTNSGHTLTYSGPAANVFGVHIGQGEFAFYFSSPISTLSLVLLGGRGISNIRTYCSLDSCAISDNGGGGLTTPLPATLPLFASVLGAGWIANRWRRRKLLRAEIAA